MRITEVFLSEGFVRRVDLLQYVKVLPNRSAPTFAHRALVFCLWPMIAVC